MLMMIVWPEIVSCCLNLGAPVSGHDDDDDNDDDDDGDDNDVSGEP